MNIVLVEPEIPANTGNIARTCALTGASLHLVKPLGFSIDDKAVKRAGLDYWDMLDIHVYDSLNDFLVKHKDSRLVLATTKSKYVHSDFKFQNDDFILFGAETRGLPELLIKKHYENSIRIPMLDNPHARSLNLSNSAAIILYEAYRQVGYEGMK